MGSSSVDKDTAMVEGSEVGLEIRSLTELLMRIWLEIEVGNETCKLWLSECKVEEAIRRRNHSRAQSPFTSVQMIDVTWASE